MPYIFVPNVPNLGRAVLLVQNEAGTVEAIPFSIVNLSGAPTGTVAFLNNSSGAYTALATDVHIRCDVSGGALAGPINLGTNAVAGQKVSVSDSTWAVMGATQRVILVTGGSTPIQDPNTGAMVTGNVAIKQAGQTVCWALDPTAAGLFLC